jgi:hypothetical protein
MDEPKLLWHPDTFVVFHSTMYFYTFDFM